MIATDYVTAREALYAAAPLAGGLCFGLPLDATGPAGEALHIDVAWLGARAPRAAVLLTGGLRGVEGFAGDAVQRSILGAGQPALPADVALLFVHTLDPSGMAWTRRANENSVDLAHNLLPPGGQYAGTPAAYADLSDALNPASPPDPNFRGIRAGMFGLQHGGAALMAAIDAGQYDHPTRLAWGGDALQQGPARLKAWIQTALKGLEQLVVVDVRTGPGADTVRATEALCAALPAAKPVEEGEPLHRWLPTLLPDARVDVAILHASTVGAGKAAYALREENRWHHHGQGGIDHPTKAGLRAAFVRADAGWHRRLCERGKALVADATKFLSV